MSYRNSSGWAFAIVTVIGLSFALLCEAQLSLDQSFTSPANLGADINECCAFIGQTYTAGKTGVLTGVSVDVHSTSIFPLHVAIRTVAGGLPTTTILGEVTLGSNASGLSQVILFPQLIPQVAGVQYAIVVNYPGAPPEGAFQFQGIWSGSTGNAYSRGDLVSSSDGGASFSFDGQNDNDVHFKTFVSSTLTVTIDVKPGEDPPTINPNSHGKIPVAILSSPTFNAPAQVARTSLTFGRTGNEHSLAFCNPNGEDVNGDGLPDLVCHFNAEKTAFQSGDTVGVLSGTTVTNVPIRGTDSIIVE
jgi:hypothetical protein